MSAKSKSRRGLLLSLGEGKTVLLPDIYGEEYSVEQEPFDDDELFVEEWSEEAPEEPVEEQESSGFDPYDTAKLFKK